MGRMRCLWKLVVGKHEERDPFSDLSIHEIIILKWILEKQYISRH
jgi:hypothetical protein